MLKIPKKLKHKNTNRPKITAGLSIKLSINMRWLILIETVGYKKLVAYFSYVKLGKDRNWWIVV